MKIPYQTKDYKKHPPVINLTKTTMDILKDKDKSGELVGLYLWYCYVAVWQDTATIWASVEYMHKLTKWSAEKIRRLRKTLLELGLIEDAQGREDGGNFGRRYVRVHYLSVLSSAVVPKSRSTVNQSPIYLESNKKCLEINNYRQPRKAADINNRDSLVGKDNSFITRHAEKLQRLLNIRSRYHPVTTSTWAKQISYLLHHDHISSKRYARIIQWYVKNKDTYDYCPQIRKATDLVDKFLVIEQMMKKQTKTNHKESNMHYHEDPDPRKSGYYDDSLEEDE